MAKQSKASNIQNILKNNTTSLGASISIKFIDDFLNTDVKNYAHYVVTTRAIPNIMDGMRIGGRKIMHAILNGDLKSAKKTKMVNVIGDTMKYEFHHGDSSLKNTIEQLGSHHLFDTAPLYIIGQKGSLRVPDASTAARYLEVSTTPYIDIFKMDKDLFDLNFEDGKWTEPKFFMPIIPVILLWRTNSPGFGFSFRSFSFKFEDVIDATLQAVIRGTCSGLDNIDMRPRIDGIKDRNLVWNSSKASWYNVGEYEISDDMLIITDLPYNVSFKKYSQHLTELKEKGILADWVSRKSKTQPIRYVLQFPKGKLAHAMKDKFKFFGMLKLYFKIPKLTLNTIDTDGQTITYFDNPNDLVDGFVKRRLTVYQQRKTRLIKIINQQIHDLDDKARFIELVVNEKVLINKRQRVDIERDLFKNNVSNAGLDLPIHKLTKEEMDKSLAKIIELKQELEYIRSTSIEAMYIKDLVAMREKYIGIEKGLTIKKAKPVIDKNNIEVI